MTATCGGNTAPCWPSDASPRTSKSAGENLSDYALSQPRASLTLKEFDRLKELQQQARDAAKAADDAREWKLKDTACYADNSVEEIWIDKDGIEKRVMTVGPHGDVC